MSHPIRRALISAILFACNGAEPIDFRVATINLRHDADCWQERFVLIGEEIGAQAPDLIGMQEVEIAVEQGELLRSDVAERFGLEYRLHQQLKTGLLAISGEASGS